MAQKTQDYIIDNQFILPNPEIADDIKKEKVE